ncbi:MAG: biotin--[acetyl-CoA-carboxylase] ligase [Candidatus Hydrothermales bacterium]
MIEIIELEEIFSTQDFIRKYIKNEKVVFVFADKQIKGKGRGKNIFFSPKGGLYVSFYLPNVKDEKKIFLITSISAFNLIEEVLKEFYLKPFIRIPNDILVKDKKVCGILIEKTEDNFICGIGINVNTQKFPENLNEASSLYLLTGKKFDLSYLKRRIVNTVLDVANWDFDLLYEKYSKNLIVKKWVQFLYNNEIYKGFLRELDKDFKIKVDLNEGSFSFSLFEIFNLRFVDEPTSMC